MLIRALLLSALALSCWPDTRAPRRVRAGVLRPSRRAWDARRTARRVALPLAVLALVGALVTIGVVGAIGIAVLGAAAYKRYTDDACAKARLAAGRALSEALRTLVAELRAGAHPAAAAESAALEAGQEAARVLRTVAATARLGGDPESVRATRSPAGGIDAVGHIGRSWSIAQRHGLPFADVLDALRRDVEGRARLAADAHADMAGPRASAVVLAVLPAAGLALGEAMGAGPARILATTSTGRLLLCAGCVLVALGLLFSGRLTRNEVSA